MSSTEFRCSYCEQLVDDDNFLNCNVCASNVHTKCLRHSSTPGDLLGDVFFDFTCAKCMQLHYNEGASTSSSAVVAREKFARQRLPWLMVITLALYNLSIKSKGLSHHGYFHWRTHIVSFINKNWDYLFESSTRRRKKWIGSVSGALSHNSPEFFISGQDLFNETGWWKLTYCNQTPKYIYRMYEQLSQKRQQQRNDKRLLEDKSYVGDQSMTTDLPESLKRARRVDSEEDFPTLTYSCSRTLPYMGRKPKIAKQLNIDAVDDEINKNLQQPFNTVQSSLMDFLAENLANDDLTIFNNLPNIAPEPLVGVGRGKNDFLTSLETPPHNIDFLHVPEIKGEPLDLNYNSHIAVETTRENQISSSLENSLQSASDDDDEDVCQPRIVQITNFQQLETKNASIEPKLNEHQIKKENKLEEEDEDESTIQHKKLHWNTHDVDSKEDDDTVYTLAPCKESLFTKQTRRNCPWLLRDEGEEFDKNDDDKTSLEMMSEYEEKQLVYKLRKIFDLEGTYKLQIPAYIRRFYRKLRMREWNRENSRPLFNLDDYLNPNNVKNKRGDIDVCTKRNIIDRYQGQLISLCSQDSRKSFYARIAGSFQYELFESPYTQRVLHPFIYRNTQCFPPWLKIMCEIQYAVNGNAPKRSSIDFCYVRPNHIAAVNALLQTVFWPGIDMSECLSYPDYSVVAMYKKLVVGCGFLVPDVGFNEAYISFMAVRPGWQRSGIATFMLYHLIQTCMSKDITLHVSATNPAVVLYQKFGFKIEEVILDFYEKYLPLDSKHSRHALFLRLMR